MKTTAKIIRIGNSRGVRLPKRLLEEMHLTGEVEVESRGGELVIRPAHNPREGWEEEFRLMHERGDDDTPEVRAWLNLPPTEWDLTEWTW